MPNSDPPHEVARIARLAHLELDPEAAPRFASQLSAILDYVALLDELVADPPMGGPCEPRLPLRADEPIPSLSRERSLANAPDAAGGHFRVPRVLGE